MRGHHLALGRFLAMPVGVECGDDGVDRPAKLGLADHRLAHGDPVVAMRLRQGIGLGTQSGNLGGALAEQVPGRGNPLLCQLFANRGQFKQFPHMHTRPLHFSPSSPRHPAPRASGASR
ncbi:hypothetical protein ACFSS8_12245 [Paracoccus kondratievae]